MSINLRAFKVCYGIINTDINTRRNGKKLYLQRARLNLRKHSFSHRVVLMWNSLPPSVVCAPSMFSFENRLDKYWGQVRLTYETDPSEFTLPIKRISQEEELDIATTCI